jgi:hypothetical protein
MTSVAREVKGDSMVLGVEQFLNRCDSIKSKRFPYNFMIGIFGADVQLENISAEFADIASNNYDADAGSAYSLLRQDVDGSSRYFFCSYSRIGASEFSSKKKGYSLRFYPIAVQHPILVNAGGIDQYYSLSIPGVMAMVVWE